MVAGSCGKNMFSFVINCQTIFQSGFHHFAFPPTMNDSSYWLTFSLVFGIINVFDFSHSRTCDIFFNLQFYSDRWGDFPVGASGKEPVCQSRRCKRCGFDPWVRKIPWRRAWQPVPVCLPGESHGQRSLLGLWSMGSQRVRHDWSDLACTHIWSIYKIYMNIFSYAYLPSEYLLLSGVCWDILLIFNGIVNFIIVEF